MNYALIGCGRVAPNHIKAVRANQLNLAAICDLVPERIDALLEKTGYALPVDRYTDYRRMIDEHPELELVLAIYKSQLTGLPVKLPMEDFSTVEMTGMFGEHKL